MTRLLRAIATGAALALAVAGQARARGGAEVEDGAGAAVEVVVVAGEDATVVLPGARVVAARWTGDGPLDPDPLLGGGGVATDAAGRARVPLPAGEGRLLFAAVAPRRAPAVVAAAGGAPAGPVRILLPAAGRVEVAVVSVAGTEDAGGGVMLLGERRGAAGVEVRLVEMGDAGGDDAPRVFRRARAGADGRALFPDVAADRPWRAEARLHGHAPAAASPVLPGGAPTELVLLPGAAVHGRVVTVPGGAPLPGARVRAGEGVATTDAEGLFRVEGLAAESVVVRIEDPRHVAMDRPEVRLRPGGVALAGTVRVRRRASVRVALRRPDGTPAAGVRVTLRHPAGAADELPPPAVSDASGIAVVDDVVPMVGQTLVVDPPPPLAREETPAFATEPGTVADLGSLFLRAGARVEGVAVDAAGRPVAGAVAVAVPEGEDPRAALADPAGGGPLRREVPLDAAGRFSVDGLAPGRWGIVVHAPGHAPAFPRAVVLRDPGSSEEVPGPVVLRAGESVTGRLADATGAPVAHAVVAAEAPGEGDVASAFTGPTGEFRVDGLARREYTLRFEVAAGHASEVVARVPVVAPAAGVAARVVKRHPVSGRVVGEGAPDAVVRIHVIESALPPEDVAVADGRVPVLAGPVDADGNFTTPPLPEGRYRVSAADGAGRLASGDVVIGTGGPPPPLSLELRGGAIVSGRAVRIGGEAVAGASVELLVGHGTRHIVPPATTGEDGRFLLVGVPAGEHTVAVRVRGGHAAEATVAVPEGQGEVSVGDVEMGAGVRLSVVVVAAAGRPAGGVDVTLLGERGSTQTATTTPSGVAAFLVPAGAYTLSLRVPGMALVRRPLRVPAAASWEERVDALEGEAREIHVARGGEAVAGARLRVFRARGGLAGGLADVEGVADAGGVATLHGLPGGAARVEVTPPGEPSVTVEASLDAGRNTILLPPAGIEGLVAEEESGVPVAGARLHLLEAAAAGDAAGAVPDGSPATVAAGDGTFRFPSVRPGAWVLEVSAPGRATVRTEPVHVGGAGVAALRLLLPAGGAISGRVIGSRGAPVIGARVRAAPARAGGARASPTEVISSPDGGYALAGLAPGVWTVEARSAGLGASRTETVNIAPGERRTVDLHLADGGTLEIAVVGPGGIPVAGAVVEVTDMFGTPVPFPAEATETPKGREGVARAVDPAPGRTDAEGRARILGLRAGTYLVAAGADGLPRATTRARVDPLVGGKAMVVLLPPPPPPSPREDGGRLVPPDSR